MALATRIIPVLLNKGGSLIKGRQFNHSRVVGSTLQAIRIYQARGVDELVYLDIDAQTGPDFDLISKFAAECFMPLTVGGGVSTLEHFRQLLAAGADKVAINTAAHQNQDLIAQAAKRFGSQAVVVSIDVRDGDVVTHCGRTPTGEAPVGFARRMESLGAGEILLNAVERDGCLGGYDLELIAQVTGAVNIPVIACGGAGTYAHLKEALDNGAHAVAASALWHFTEETPKGAAQYLALNGHNTRLAA
jgi:cyclase